MASWDVIYEAAIDKPCGSAELKAKDEARAQVNAFGMSLGLPDVDKEECPEDAIEEICDRFHIQFDLRGNIKKIRLPEAIKAVLHTSFLITRYEREIDKIITRYGIKPTDREWNAMIEYCEANDDDGVNKENLCMHAVTLLCEERLKLRDKRTIQSKSSHE